MYRFPSDSYLYSATLGGVPLQWVKINDLLPEPIWSKRSEVIQRLLARVCELCGATATVEVYHFASSLI